MDMIIHDPNTIKNTTIGPLINPPRKIAHPGLQIDLRILKKVVRTNYFLIAPKEIPLTRCLRKIMVNIIGGSRNTKLPAAAAPQS